MTRMSTPSFSRWVAKLWRSVCGPTRLAMSAARAALPELPERAAAVLHFDPATALAAQENAEVLGAVERDLKHGGGRLSTDPLRHHFERALGR